MGLRAVDTHHVWSLLVVELWLLRLFLSLFLLFVGSLILWEPFEIQWRDFDVLNVFETRLFNQVLIYWHVFKAVVWVKTELIILRGTHSQATFLGLLIPWLLVLSHDFLKTVSFDELDPILLIYFIDWNPFILQCEEEVNKLGNLIGIISFFFIQLFALSLQLMNLNQ